MTAIGTGLGPVLAADEPIERTAAASGDRRVARVDALRAAAALAVLIGHAYALGGRAVPIRAERWYDVGLLAGTTGVWLFFAISGFVISRPFVDRLIGEGPLPDLRGYLMRRAARIFPLFWIALSAYLLIEGTQGASGWQLGVHYLLLNNLVPGREEALLSVAWTLTLEVVFYAALPLAAIAIRRTGALAGKGRAGTTRAERLALLLLISWGTSILFTAAADLLGDGELGLWLRGSFPAMWQMFCPGILLAIVPHLSHRSLPARLADRARSPAGAVAAAAALLVAVIASARAPLRFGIVPYQLVVDGTRPLFAVGYGIIVARALTRSGRPGAPSHLLLELGLASYGIYLLHPIVIDLLLSHPTLIPLAGGDEADVGERGAQAAAVTLPAAMLSWRLVERPAIAAARRLGGRR